MEEKDIINTQETSEGIAEDTSSVTLQEENVGGESDNEKNDKKADKKPKEKKLRGRRRLYADYQYKDVKNKRGKSVRRKVYTGKHYGFVIPKEYKKNQSAYIRKVKLTYLSFYLIALIAWLMPSLAIESQSMGKVVEGVSVSYYYVLFPYIVGALPLMLIFLTVTEFLFTKGNKHEQAFMEALTKNLRGQIVMLMTCAVITAIAEAAFMILNFKKIVSPFAEAGVLLFMLMLIGTCIFWLRKQENFPMQTL